jgi:hypothetical protein
MTDDIVKAVESATVIVFSPRAELEKDAEKKRKSSSRGKGGGNAPPPDDPPPPDDAHGGPDDGGYGDLIDRMNREWAFVLLGKDAVIMREKADAPERDRVRFLNRTSFSAYLQNQTERYRARQRNILTGEWEDVCKTRKIAPAWLNSERRRTFDGVEFFPDRDNAPGTPGYFNLWRGYSATPDPAPPTPRQRGAADRSEKYFKFHDHLRANICAGDDVIFKWVWHWFAHLIQRPRERIGTALVMRGRMGTGKSKVGEIIGSLFSSHYISIDSPHLVTGQFNAHMAWCILMLVDEGFWAGDKQAEGRLKGLITSSEQMIEAKGVDPIKLANYIRLLISSNEDWVIPAGMDERRFCVLDVGEGNKEDHGFFRAMDAEMNSGGREALLADLLAVDLDASDAPNLRNIPKTGALLEQKVRSLDPLAAWWLGRLMDGSQTHRAIGWRTQPIPIRTLYRDYSRTTEEQGVRRRSGETEFGMRMRRLLPALKVVRATEDVEEEGFDGRPVTVLKRVNCWRFPSLEDARDEFQRALGQAVEWNEDAENGGDHD